MKFIIDFLSELLKLIQVQSTNQPPNKADEEVKNAYEWFIKKLKDSKQKELAQHQDPYFQPGKIYVFKYEPDPTHHPYYDKHPIALSLGKMPAKEGFMNVCVNLSWYPPKVREYMIKEIRKMYKSEIEKEIKKKPLDAKDQAPINNIDLYAIKERLDLFGFSWAIRCYLPGRIKDPKVVVAYEHWDKVVKMDQPRIFPEIQGTKIKPLMKIYEDFEKVYLPYQQDKQGEIKKRRDEAKKQMKFKFIK